MYKKRGRNNAYDDVIKPHLEDIRHLVMEGYTRKQIMDYLGIKKTAFYKHMSERSEFKEVIEARPIKLGIKLEKTLYKAAFGYDYTEKHIEYEESSLGFKKKQKEITRHAKPNPTLLMFVLCNKFPEKWRRLDKEIIEKIEEIEKEEVTDKRLKLVYKLMNPSLTDNQLEEETQKIKVVGEDD